MKNDVKINWWLAVPVNIMVIVTLNAIVLAPGILAIWTGNPVWWLGFIPHLLILIMTILSAIISYNKTKYLAEKYGELFDYQ